MEQRPYLNAELFRVNFGQLKEALNQVETCVCSPYFPPKASALFSNDWQALLHILKLLELEGTQAVIQEIDGELKIIALSEPKSDTYYPYHYRDRELSIYLSSSEKITFKDSVGDIFPIARTFLAKGIQSKVVPPLKCEGWTVYDVSSDLSTQISEENKRTGLLQPLQVHTGFAFQFRIFGSDLLVQILPKCKMSYNKSIWEMIKEGWTNGKVLEQFPYVHIPSQGSQKLIEVLSKTISDPINEPPYYGRSFLDFANAMFPDYTIDDDKILLVKTASSYSRDVNYYPSSWAYPSLTFSNISYIDENYYSQLTGILKAQGRKRMTEAQEWAKRFSSLEILKHRVEIESVPTKLFYDPQILEPSAFSGIDSFDIGRIFGPPSITMIRNGISTEIIQGVETYQATVNDLLLHEELKPLDVPDKMNLIVFVHAPLWSGWEKLKEALTSSRTGYRGFKDTFGVELSFTEEIVEDFLSPDFADRVDSLPERGYHCAIVVIPRHLESPEKTGKIYTEVKTRIMLRGIPVQVITDEQKVTLGRNSTLEGKSKSNYTLFGISLNILAKAGGVLTALAESVASNLIPNSLTIGYDVARVIPKDMMGVKTIPLTAPLVIFDNRGAYVSHQYAYKLRDEVSLFEQYGDKIFEKIPTDTTTVIVHKGGWFTTKELSSLDNLSSKYGVETIPISIRTSAIPRVANPYYFGSELGLKAGTVLPLSRNDFLMMTTPFRKWDPNILGWPNPILITLHGTYDVQKKLRLLYHIFALTKMQTGSQRAVRLPVSTHFSNMISRFLRKVGDPNPVYLKYFVQTKSGGKNLPRWFL